MRTRLLWAVMLALVLVAGLSTPASAQQPRAAAVETRFLVADYDNNRVLEVDSSGAVLFRYGEPATKTTVIEAPARAFRLANGNTMMVDNGEIAANPRVYGRALEVTPAGGIVNQVTGLFLPTDVQVLPNGKWLISELSKYRRRVIEVVPGTHVTDATPAVYRNVPVGANAQVGVFSAVRLPNGNTVISDHGLNKVVEIGPAGNEIRQLAQLGAPTRVSVTPDGMWLIPEKARFQVLEYNPATGQVVRVFKTGKNPGPVDRDKFLLGSAERLPNGNTLIADGENNRIIEMDNSGQVVRTLPKPTGNLGAGTGQTCVGATVATYGCPYDASYVPDFTKPVISSVTPSTATTTQQRIQVTVVATDPPSVGSSRSGVTKFDYSIDGVNFLTALMIEPSFDPGPQTFDVDLANPGAGGNWDPGLKTVRVRVADQEGRQSDVVPSNVTFTPGPLTAQYFAEGYTGTGFDEYVTVGNPNGVPIQVSVFFQYAGGSTGVPGTMVSVAANQRATLSINAAAGANKELSLRLVSDNPFIAERPMYFSTYSSGVQRAAVGPPRAALSGIDGGHLGVAAPAPAAAWFFAEGYTGAGFDSYFTIQNPNTAPSNVKIIYYLAGGGSVERTLVVGGQQRTTVAVHSATDPAGLGPNQAFSSKVETTNVQPLIVERVMYFRYQSANVGTVTGGTATLGATAAATKWHFAEGYTGAGFDEFITIQNPANGAVTGTITYYVEGEGATPKAITLPPLSRTTVPVHDATHPSALGRGKAHATTVQTSMPTVVERPMYFLYNGASIAGIDGGHNVMGATNLLLSGESVLFAEGYTGSGFEQYLTLQNPNATAATVSITYLLADGPPSTPVSVTIPANQRKTITVHAPGNGGLGPNKAFSTRVDVIHGGTSGVLAERVMYFDYNGVATGGTSAFGAPNT